LIPQFFVGELAGRTVFDFGFDGQLLVDLRVGVFIEQVVNDIHFATHAPARPGFTVA
jgi:hypothetical protein